MNGMRASTVSRVVAGAIAVVLAAASPALAGKKSAKKAATTGTLNVLTSVPGASVQIDGLDVGVTPVEPVEVSPGDHDVLVKKPGFLDFSEKVKVFAGKSTDEAVDLLPVKGVLKVEATEPGCSVIVDGKDLGKAPISDYELFPGDHVVVVRKEGLQPYQTKLKVDAGSAYSLRAVIDHASGKVAGGTSPKGEVSGFLLPDFQSKPPEKAAANAPLPDLGDLPLGDLVPIAPLASNDKPKPGAKKKGTQVAVASPQRRPPAPVAPPPPPPPEEPSVPLTQQGWFYPTLAVVGAAALAGAVMGITYALPPQYVESRDPTTACAGGSCTTVLNQH